MKPSTYIKRKVPICLLHPWDRRRIARTLHRRAKTYLHVAAFLLLAGSTAFRVAAPLGVLVASLVAILTAGGLLGRAWFLASMASKHDV